VKLEILLISDHWLKKGATAPHANGRKKKKKRKLTHFPPSGESTELGSNRGISGTGKGSKREK